jgi:hypothetical protein
MKTWIKMELNAGTIISHCGIKTRWGSYVGFILVLQHACSCGEVESQLKLASPTTETIRTLTHDLMTEAAIAQARQHSAWKVSPHTTYHGHTLGILSAADKDCKRVWL